MNQEEKKQVAVIIGAGPAGLTAAYELLQHTAIQPIVIDAAAQVGGISATIDYHGNKLDLGGHRFFSKSDRVMQWWLDMLPLQGGLTGEQLIHYQGKARQLVIHTDGPDPVTSEQVMLLRPRKSRIYFQKQFFDYPLSVSWKTLRQLGLFRVAYIGWSYVLARLRPIRPERTLEDFFINRFGKRLYRLFFQSYTEKVWGRRCTDMTADWGAQRIKGVSVASAVRTALQQRFRWLGSTASVETSLIEQFLYPKYGPGQMWETAAEKITAAGGSLLLNHQAVNINVIDQAIHGVTVRDTASGSEQYLPADYVFSSMPIPQLLQALDQPLPPAVATAVEALQFRDFLIVGVLLTKETFQDATGAPLTDNWLYIQDPDVSVGRIQLFHNWSPGLVADPETHWVGMEYFLSFGDEVSHWTDQQWISHATTELERLGFAHASQVLDTTVLLVPRAYPVYTDGFTDFPLIRSYLDQYAQLFCIGRNGMHRYNNQDHSMLAAMTAVDLIVAQQTDKSRLWEVNTEDDYHESH